MKKKILTVFGTRPEAIKMAPVVKAIQQSDSLTSLVCSTGQHQEMLLQVIDFFNVKLDYELNVMQESQSLTELTSNLFSKIPEILEVTKPDLVLVHGDTATTFAAAFSSFLSGVEVGHIEAGLRSGDISSPWPEEANRKLTTVISKYHFAPTVLAKNTLLSEGIKEDCILVTGNTVVDALLAANETINHDLELKTRLGQSFGYLNKYKNFILVTVHRRESFGKDLVEICNALIDIAQFDEDTALVIPVHLNPNVRIPILDYLRDIKNIFLINPLDYASFVYLMKNCHFILTDSGGVQEEAPSFGKPVLVLRNVTERPEGVEAGCLELTGTSRNEIFNKAKQLLSDDLKYEMMSNVKNPYGDGFASNKIVEFISNI